MTLRPRRLVKSAAVKTFRHALPALLLLALLTACGDRRPQRVVLVTLDTLRYDGLVPAEGEPSPMPNLMRRARDGGAVFERFYSSTSVTQPSHASMFTALQPWEHGVVSNGQILQAQFATVAERLRDEGFATGAIVASFPVAGRFGFAQGFEDFSDEFVEQPVAWRRWEGHEVPESTFYSLADTITDRGLELVDRMARRQEAESRGQFLWLHYFDPHDPYGDTAGGEVYSPYDAFEAIEEGRDTAPLLRAFRQAYDRDLGALDRQLERLLTRLDADSDRFSTHVVVASDHGESFGEEGAIAHGKRITEEQIRVPLVILSPQVEPGMRGDVAGSIDVAPTLLSLAGVPFDREPWSNGRDLTVPAPSAEELRAAEPGLRGGTFGMRRTFRKRRTIELRADGSEVVIPRYHFYAVDRAGRVYRGNHQGLLGQSEPIAEPVLHQVLAAFAAFERQAESAAAPAAADEESQKALRALGYLD